MEQRLFIRLVDGQPFEHPIIEQNFVDAFPDIDINNLPENFAEFIRVERPTCGIFETADLVYQFEGSFVKDIWTVRSMTDAERTAKIEESRQNKPFDSWIFNEELCVYEPPVACPNDGKSYRWDESVINWIEA